LTKDGEIIRSISVDEIREVESFFSLVSLPRSDWAQTKANLLPFSPFQSGLFLLFLFLIWDNMSQGTGKLSTIMDYKVIITRNEEIGKYLIARQKSNFFLPKNIFLIPKINKTNPRRGKQVEEGSELEFFSRSTFESQCIKVIKNPRETFSPICHLEDKTGMRRDNGSK
jgi:hypothetical protein